MTASEITEIYNDIITLWGEEVGGNVIIAIHEAPKYRGNGKLSWDEYLDYCTAYDGNWIKLISSGLQEIAPEVFDALPDNLGEPSLAALVIYNIIHLLGIELPF